MSTAVINEHRFKILTPLSRSEIYRRLNADDTTFHPNDREFISIKYQGVKYKCVFGAETLSPGNRYVMGLKSYISAEDELSMEVDKMYWKLEDASVQFDYKCVPIIPKPKPFDPFDL